MHRYDDGDIHRQSTNFVAQKKHTVTVPAFRPRMVCTSCGIVRADARPNWQKREGPDGLTGTQWR
jgi:hypothetical protein